MIWNLFVYCGKLAFILHNCCQCDRLKLRGEAHLMTKHPEPEETAVLWFILLHIITSTGEIFHIRWAELNSLCVSSEQHNSWYKHEAEVISWLRYLAHFSLWLGTSDSGLALLIIRLIRLLVRRQGVCLHCWTRHYDQKTTRLHTKTSPNIPMKYKEKPVSNTSLLHSKGLVLHFVWPSTTIWEFTVCYFREIA